MDISIVQPRTPRHRPVTEVRPGVDVRPAILLAPFCADARRSYCAELPSDLLDEQGQTLDWVIGIAFDRLDARHLDLRVVPSDS
jgi:hypothetical protein